MPSKNVGDSGTGVGRELVKPTICSTTSTRARGDT